MNLALSHQEVKQEEYAELFPLLLRYLQELDGYQQPGVPRTTPESARLHLRYLTSAPACRVWWVILGEERIGFIFFRLLPRPPWSEAPVGFIDEFYIAPEHRRQGYGRAIIEQVLACLREQGATGVRLTVLVRNAPALAFWQAMGFQMVGTLLGNAYVMERALEGRSFEERRTEA